MTPTWILRLPPYILTVLVGVVRVVTIIVVVAGLHIASTTTITFFQQRALKNGTPPHYFVVAVENIDATPHTFAFVYLERLPAELRQPSRSLRLSVTSHEWPEMAATFKVIESSANSQVIEVTQADLVAASNRYRVTGEKITPLSVSYHGDIGFALFDIVFLVLAIWGGSFAARRARRWFHGPAAT